jgi:HEAT repeat protein
MHARAEQRAATATSAQAAASSSTREELPQRGGASLESLVADVAGSDPRMRVIAQRALTQRDGADVNPAVMQLVHHATPAVSQVATQIIEDRYRNGRGNVDDVVHIAEDTRLGPPTRFGALACAGLKKSDQAGDLLAKLVKSGSDLERSTAASLLANQAPDRAVPALLDALADPDLAVRKNAGAALQRIAKTPDDLDGDPTRWRDWWKQQSRR